jgi:hypothetical protein
MMNLKRLFLCLAMLLLVSITGCRTIDVNLCVSVSPKSDTLPTCTTCVLTWGSNGTIVEGTVQTMTKNYTKASIVVDRGLPTALEIPITLMSNNQPFLDPVSPAPAQKPTTALLYLYYKYPGIVPLLRDSITVSIH